MFLEFMDMEEYRQWKRELLATGWQRHSNSCDSSVAQENVCIYCNGGNNYYEGFQKGKEYHSIMVCPDCKTAYEF